jgi:hypothetical protein
METNMDDYKLLIQQKLLQLRRERETVQTYLESLQKEENDLQLALDVLAKFSKREDSKASVPRITLADRVLQTLSHESLTIRGIMGQIPDTIPQKNVSAVLSVLKKQGKVSHFKGVWSLMDRHSLKVQTPDLLGKLTNNNNEGTDV